MPVGTMTIVGGILSLIGTGAGLWMQKNENEKINKLSMKLAKEQNQRSDERYKTELALTQEQIKDQRRERRKQWAWQKEDRNWNRARDTVNQFVSLINSSPNYANNLQNIFPRRF